MIRNKYFMLIFSVSLFIMLIIFNSFMVDYAQSFKHVHFNELDYAEHDVNDENIGLIHMDVLYSESLEELEEKTKAANGYVVRATPTESIYEAYNYPNVTSGAENFSIVDVEVIETYEGNEKLEEIKVLSYANYDEELEMLTLAEENMLIEDNEYIFYIREVTEDEKDEYYANVPEEELENLYVIVDGMNGSYNITEWKNTSKREVPKDNGMFYKDVYDKYDIKR